MNIVYDIDRPSELDAGIIGFHDEITVAVRSGDPGGVNGEFADFLREQLAEWYDGASVTIVQP